MKQIVFPGEQLKLELEIIINCEEKLSFDVEELKFAIDLFVKKYLKDGDLA